MDGLLDSYMSTIEEENDVSAGPSSRPFYEPRSFPAGPPSPPRLLHSTDDLITRCGIFPSYDDFVRPFIKPTSDTHPDPDNKGKGKEAVNTELLDQDGAPKKKRKFEHSYKSFLVDIPGRLPGRKDKDSYLSDLVRAPEKQRIDISKFDNILLEGFKLIPGALPHDEFSPTVFLAPDGADAEKKKKKKKNRALPDGSLAQNSNAPQPTTPMANGAGPSTSVSTPRRISVATNGTLPHTNGNVQPSIRTPNPAQPPGNVKTGKVRKERDEPPNHAAGSVSTPMGSLAGAAGMAGGAQRPPKKRKVEPPPPPMQQPTPIGMT